MRFHLGGALALIMAATGTAHAQTSHSTGFESSDGFVAGSALAPGATEGNTEWVAAANGSTNGQIVTGIARSGTQSLAISRNSSGNDGVVHGVRSPELSSGAGETQSGAAYDTFTASWWIRSGASSAAENIAAGGSQNVSINAWSTDRMSWFGLNANGGALSATVNGMNSSDAFVAGTIATGLAFGEWYRVEQTIQFVDSASGGDDIVTFAMFDALGDSVGTSVTTSWDAGFLAPSTFYPTATLSPVNQLNFRSSNTTTGINAYIDDVSYSASNAGVGAVPEPAGWAMMIGGFGLVGAAMRRRTRMVHATA